MKADNILIVNTFGIGDVLFSTPLIKEIKRNLPEARVHFLCNRRNVDLLKNDPDIASVIVFEKDEFRECFKQSRMRFVGKLAGLIREIRRLDIDVAIDLTLNYQMNIILILAGIGMRVGFNYKNRGRLLTHRTMLSSFDKKHIVEYYIELLKFFSLAVPNGHRLRSYTSQDAKKRADKLLKEKGVFGKELVGIAAGGGKSWGLDAVYRRWDSANFAYVGLKLSQMDNIQVLLFGTGEELEICKEILSVIGPRAVSLCGATDLDLLVELIGRCRLLICNEGGPLHIAVSQDVKTISLFGPVDDKVYGPYPPSERHKVIKAQDVECRPCYKNFKHRICDVHVCLTGINRDEVVEAAKESLGL